MKTEPVFLDDKLYEFISGFDLKPTEESINEAYRGLIRICDDYRINKLSTERRKPIIKAGIDRIFISWDAFVKRLSKENHILANLLAKNNYKVVLFSNKEFLAVYNSL